MKVKKLVQQPNGWTRFHLNVGGFLIKNCRWREATGQILLPLRYDMQHNAHKVVFAHGVQVKRLQQLLLSGEAETPRDRRPCTLKIHKFGLSHDWVIFDFTVRGFTILGCRWQPETGSIQLPVTFAFNEQKLKYAKKRVVCAFGTHINRLRTALHKEWAKQHPQPVEEEVIA